MRHATGSNGGKFLTALVVLYYLLHVYTNLVNLAMTGIIAKISTRVRIYK